jgi:hypothetical protein
MNSKLYTLSKRLLIAVGLGLGSETRVGSHLTFLRR